MTASADGSKLWKVLCVLLLIGLLAMTGWWWWDGRAADRQVREAETSAQEAVAALEASRDTALRQLADREAAALARGFGAGIGPWLGGEDLRPLDAALGELIKVEGLVFAHLFAPDGQVLVASDRKVSEVGRAGERTEWALVVEEVTAQEGALEGTTEVAVPVRDAQGERLAVLLVGYDTAAVLDRMAPPVASPSSP